MDNHALSDTLSLVSKLMDIHGANSFKAKSYSIAAFAVDKLEVPAHTLSESQLAAVQGIGSSSARKIIQLISTGHLAELDQLVAETPRGIIDMMQIKGLGPKKIHAIWKEMGIETIGELLYACKENRLKLYKGFGEKTQQNVAEAIEFFLKHQDEHLYASLTELASSVLGYLSAKFPGIRIEITGAFRRQLEIVGSLDFVLACTKEEILAALHQDQQLWPLEVQADSKRLDYKTNSGVKIHLYPSDPDSFVSTLISSSSSEAFQKILSEKGLVGKTAGTEEDYFAMAGLPMIPAFLREEAWVLDTPLPEALNQMIQWKHIRGIIHSHSQWSDGSQSIEEMAKEAIKLGLEYLVISDHSQSAFYANGLTAERIRQQHQEIDRLNATLAPFRILKSIEADILQDGQLDYPDEVLASFDLVIASVHSNLKMSEEKAMARLLAAIQNPYTSILGHMTGRLLLSRPGYPLRMNEILDACARAGVVIEINANPNRLDIDWRWIKPALDRGITLSINPDAHSTEGYQDIHFGIAVAQKALLKPTQNLSSFSLDTLLQYIEKRKTMR